MRRILACTSLLLLAACGDSTSPDPGSTDAADVGVSDASGGDAGVTDAGASDTGGSDDTGGAEDGGGEDVMADSGDPDTPEDVVEDAEDAGSDTPEDTPAPTWTLDLPSDARGRVGESIRVEVTVLGPAGTLGGIVLDVTADDGVTLPVEPIVTGPEGRASFDIAFGTTPGVSTITVRAGDETGSFDVERLVGPVAELTASTATVLAPSVVTIDLEATDTFGNPVSDARLGVMGEPGIGEVDVPGGELRTDADGLAAFDIEIAALDEATPFGTPVHVATVDGDDTSVFVELTFVDPDTVVVTDDLPAHLVVPSRVEDTATVQVTDEAGAPLAGVAVELVVTDVGWTGSVGTTDEDGIALLTIRAPLESDAETGFGIGLAGSEPDTSRLALPFYQSMTREGSTIVPDFGDDEWGDALYIDIEPLDDDHVTLFSEHTFSDGFEREALWVLPVDTMEPRGVLAHQEFRTFSRLDLADGAGFVMFGTDDDEDRPAQLWVFDASMSDAEAIYEEGYDFWSIYELGNGEIIVSFQDVVDPSDRPYEMHRYDHEAGTLEFVHDSTGWTSWPNECNGAFYYQYRDGRQYRYARYFGGVEETWGSTGDRLQFRHFYADDGSCLTTVHDHAAAADDALSIVVRDGDELDMEFLWTGASPNDVTVASDLSFVISKSWGDDILRRADLGDEIVVTEISDPLDGSWSWGFTTIQDDTRLLVAENWRRSEPEVFWLPTDGSSTGMPEVLSLPVDDDSETAMQAWGLSADERWMVVVQTMHDQPVGEGLDGSTMAGVWIRDIEGDPSTLEPLDVWGTDTPFTENDTDIETAEFAPTGTRLVVTGDPIEADLQSIWIADPEAGLVRTAFVTDAMEISGGTWWSHGGGLVVVYTDTGAVIVDADELMAATD